MYQGAGDGKEEGSAGETATSAIGSAAAAAANSIASGIVLVAWRRQRAVDGALRPKVAEVAGGTACDAPPHTKESHSSAQAVVAARVAAISGSE